MTNTMLEVDLDFLLSPESPVLGRDDVELLKSTPDVPSRVSAEWLLDNVSVFAAVSLVFHLAELNKGFDKEVHKFVLRQATLHTHPSSSTYRESLVYDHALFTVRMFLKDVGYPTLYELGRAAEEFEHKGKDSLSDTRYTLTKAALQSTGAKAIWSMFHQHGTEHHELFREPIRDFIKT